jgi:hypothetical protein
MKHLTYQWKSRVIIILAVSVIISALLVLLDTTEWAQQINIEGFSHDAEEGKKMPLSLMFILPFIKEVILIFVPMFLTLLVIKVFSIIKNRKKNII